MAKWGKNSTHIKRQRAKFTNIRSVRNRLEKDQQFNGKGAKDMDSPQKKATQMSSKHTKSCLTSLVIRERQITATLRYHLPTPQQRPEV